MINSFVVNGNHISTGIAKLLNIFFGLHDHKVDIDVFLRMLSDSAQYRESERYVWNKNTVHHIHMYPLCFAAVQHLNIALKISKISAQNGRSNDYFTHAGEYNR